MGRATKSRRFKNARDRIMARYYQWKLTKRAVKQQLEQCSQTLELARKVGEDIRSEMLAEMYVEAFGTMMKSMPNLQSVDFVEKKLRFTNGMAVIYTPLPGPLCFFESDCSTTDYIARDEEHLGSIMIPRDEIKNLTYKGSNEKIRAILPEMQTFFAKQYFEFFMNDFFEDKINKQWKRCP